MVLSHKYHISIYIALIWSGPISIRAKNVLVVRTTYLRKNPTGEGASNVVVGRCRSREMSRSANVAIGRFSVG